MKLALIGTHGVGKTTLAFEICSLLKKADYNVELVTAERIGIETTTYVRNIFKYYAAYKLTLDAQAAQKRAREEVTRVGPSQPVDSAK